MPDESTLHEAAATIPIQYPSPPASVHSNCLLVQSADCMYLHFFQLRPPMVTSQDAAQSAVAEPVASIEVSFDRMQEFINVMQHQFNSAKIPSMQPQEDDHSTQSDEDVVSGADLAMDEFRVTERDAAEVRHAIASGQGRPRFPLPSSTASIK